MFKDLVEKARSVRRFDESALVATSLLRQFVDVARQTPSFANAQPLKYLVSNELERNARIFETLKWFSVDATPSSNRSGERPTAYVVILSDRELWSQPTVDYALAAYAILLAATEQDLAGCIVTGIDRNALRGVLHIAERYEIAAVVALGKPIETVSVVTARESARTAVPAESERARFVRKRAIEEVLLDDRAASAGRP